MKLRISIDDITIEQIDFCDRYIKKVITNAKRYSYREKVKIRKYNIIICDLESQLKHLQFEEEGFIEIFTTNIMVNKTIIPLYDLDLAEVILKLSKIQRETVLRNIVLEDKLTDIARERGVSVTMISKHKKKALQIIKQELLYKK